MASPFVNCWKALCALTLLAAADEVAGQEIHPTIRVKNTFALVRENDTRGTNVAFKFTLAPPTDRPVSVKYTTTDGSAAAPSDYTAISGTLIFPPGSTEQVL